VPSIYKLIFLRQLPMFTWQLIPFVGNIFAMADYALIFDRSQRCIHDLLAGTNVVRHDT